MLEQIKSVIQQIGLGLSAQHMGEMSAVVEKINKRSQNFQLAGGQGRIVLITSTDLLGPALDFVINLAGQTGSMIEVLYITPADDSKNALRLLLSKLASFPIDFQLTRLTGNLFETIATYNTQREDIMSVVCSSTEPFSEELISAPTMLEPELRFTFPTVLFVGNDLLA